MHEVEPVARRQSDKTQTQIAVRLDDELIRRMESMIDKLHEVAEFKALQVTRVDVLRLALSAGLDVLEERYGKPPAPTPATRKRPSA